MIGDLHPRKTSSRGQVNDIAFTRSLHKLCFVFTHANFNNGAGSLDSRDIVPFYSLRNQTGSWSEGEAGTMNVKVGMSEWIILEDTGSNLELLRVQPVLGLQKGFCNLVCNNV
jgi:hypothetical protein